MQTGLELTHRDVDAPIVDLTALNTIYEERDELMGQYYLYWLPNNNWSLTAEIDYDRFENASNAADAATIPDEVTTWTRKLNATSLCQCWNRGIVTLLWLIFHLDTDCPIEWVY